jgi:hypothetical protein
MTQRDTDMAAIAFADEPVEIPSIEPATPAEIERRRVIVERILRRRERIGPIGIRADELLHVAESEA